MSPNIVFTHTHTHTLVKIYTEKNGVYNQTRVKGQREKFLERDKY